SGDDYYSQLSPEEKAEAAEEEAREKAEAAYFAPTRQEFISNALADIAAHYKETVRKPLGQLFNEGESRRILTKINEKIATDPTHPARFIALEGLVRVDNRATKIFALKALFEMSLDQTQQHAEDAKRHLECLREEDQIVYLSILNEIAQDQEHPRRYDAASSLLTLLYIQGDIEIAQAALREIAADSAHPRRYDAAEKILYSQVSGDTEIAFTAFREIAADPTHPHQQDAQDQLW
ncbi:MAG: hypothetical protein V4482_06755, partial [Pseudomonadota bacterium]